jgi:hypothetical protein
MSEQTKEDEYGKHKRVLQRASETEAPKMEGRCSKLMYRFTVLADYSKHSR